MSSDSQYLVTASDRMTLLQGPLGAVLMLSGNQTAGRLSVLEHPLAPRALGSPVHTHRNEDEYSVVLEGVVGAQIAEQVIEAGPGAVLVKPRGVPHAFWNPSDQPARLLELISPAGFEQYFTGLADILSGPGAPDAGQLAALADRYGLDLDLASIPRLAAAYGLRIALPERMPLERTRRWLMMSKAHRAWSPAWFRTSSPSSAP
ncbi:MAG: cupin domain-containing protein [Streptosporangiaceae bacterium]|nr:cupin domain-containing protein [Streptosporangiaceae bacterium]